MPFPCFYAARRSIGSMPTVVLAQETEAFTSPTVTPLTRYAVIHPENPTPLPWFSWLEMVSPVGTLLDIAAYGAIVKYVPLSRSEMGR